jgi:maltooligosyltrehalose trehalohydrolase
MQAVANGVFALETAALPGHDYTYRLDGRPDRPDPVSRWQPHGVHGPSRIVDATAHRWGDSGWRGRAMAELSLYELHVGTFTPEGTFDAVVGRLPYLHDLGVTAIELMPVAEFPGSRNWGYDGVSLYAPESSYGGPEGLRRLVDAAHRHELAVVLDVVYNHLGPEGNYLAEFGPYFTDRYRTPWGSALNYDGADSDGVRRYIIDNALSWVTEYHIDGLRLDAVHGIFDFGAQHILQELTDQVHAAGTQLGREIVVIAESDLNDPRLVRTPDQGGYGLDAQWSDDFHHAVHAELTGERSGYYGDFGGLETLATAMRDRFVYAGRYSAHRRRRHGAPATDVSADHFVVAVQNHDQVGNRAAGDRLSTLISLDGLKTAAALLLLSPYVPLLFMGEEYGETNPFRYFVSHSDPALVEAVRRGRRDEFAAFGWADAVPDPQSETTFLQSRLDWSRLETASHRHLLALYTDLLHLRRREPALRPGASAVDVLFDGSGGWLALQLRPAEGAPVLLLSSLQPARERVRVPVEIPGRWELLLTSDDARYGGAGGAGFDGTELHLPGLGAAVLRG